MKVRIQLLNFTAAEHLSLRTIHAGDPMSSLPRELVASGAHDVPGDLDSPIELGAFVGTFDREVFFDASEATMPILLFSDRHEPVRMVADGGGKLILNLSDGQKVAIARARRTETR